MFGILKNHKTADIKLASLFRTLGNPSRVALVKRICQQDTCIDEEFFGSDVLVPRTVALHLMALKRAGIIKGSISRRNTSYCIDMEVLEEFRTLFEDLYNEAKQHQQLVMLNKGKCN